MKNRLALNMKTLRERHYMTQEDLADELNVTRARIGGWEEERNEPPINMILKMAKVFKVSPGNLITYKYV